MFISWVTVTHFLPQCELLSGCKFFIILESDRRHKEMLRYFDTMPFSFFGSIFIYFFILLFSIHIKKTKKHLHSRYGELFDYKLVGFLFQFSSLFHNNLCNQ